MQKQRVLIVFGTRPEAIKLAPVVHALAGHPRFETVVCVTGQHRDLLDQVLDTFQIVPDYDLDLMQPGQALGEVATRIFAGVDKVLAECAPHFVLVHGDTTTCFAASLAAFYRRIPVGHVEAGLRTWDASAPFPEEAHRAMVGRLAALHFAPTEQAKLNLIGERVDPSRIHVTGNTVIDALHIAQYALVGATAKDFAHILASNLVEDLSNSDRKVVLVSAHRRENHGARLDSAMTAVRELANRHQKWRFVYLLHPHPEARRAPLAALSGLANVSLVEPLGYLPFVWLLQRANAVLTDSGGLQEEASELGKPILVMRDVTERQEAVEYGAARLVGTEPARIVEGIERAVLVAAPARTRARRHFYGDGKASQRIVEILASALLAEGTVTRTPPRDTPTPEGERPSRVAEVTR
ncbi:MAG TPA: UDP-N-acetylglucosamine 2-epimerase (non-hydrolyzing) [Bauldia sp.]|nr:UDP-N-acetylglucosamine 2-epimerase (non-hydrolyzing) [Bauldia sp.]